MGQRTLKRVRGRRRKEEEAEESEELEEKSGGVVQAINNLTIETVVTEEEAADGLKAALGMEVEETGEGEGDEGVEGTQTALGALELLT